MCVSSAAVYCTVYRAVHCYPTSYLTVQYRTVTIPAQQAVSPKTRVKCGDFVGGECRFIPPVRDNVDGLCGRRGSRCERRRHSGQAEEGYVPAILPVRAAEKVMLTIGHTCSSRTLYTVVQGDNSSL